ncbi:MAG: sigma 54-interacting transcriptional regulator [Desulfuromonadales bacterium]|nr:sigma 54-interacting transcriptional regulator [Desulfuromonadales bacterium]
MGIDKDKILLPTAAKLRRQAEERLRANRADVPAPMNKIEAQRLVHELEVHQIELEMQNEELRRVREESELSRTNYSELYDFAPIAYFIFDAQGVIEGANLTGASLLEIERGALIKRPFSDFISNANDREIFSNHLALVMHRKVMLRCEIRLTGKDGSLIYGQLQSVAMDAIEGKQGLIFTSIVDDTVHRKLGDELQKAYDTMEETVHERTEELKRANAQLKQEIDERKKAEKSLQVTYAEIKLLKDRLHEENIYLQQELAQKYNFGEIVGQSNPLVCVFSQIEQVAPMNATVLLLGETGTGKGVVARAIHGRSIRKGRPLITVNCTTLPATLIESELFGRERGAFTGSDARQIGRFELADGGTIFLDEIGDLPLELQSKLLRVIQDGEFERLGSPRTIKVDVRIIAATNRDLEEEIHNRKFREDLYYRLNVFPITMPPLRQLREDIPLLVNHFVEKFNKKIGKKINSVSKDTLHMLQDYHWPGNVRELESVIERSVITSQGTTLQVLDRFDTFRQPDEPAGQDVKALADLEQDHILQVLRKTGWRIEGKSGAAIILGLNASTLRARMRKFGIVRT